MAIWQPGSEASGVPWLYAGLASWQPGNLAFTGTRTLTAQADQPGGRKVLERLELRDKLVGQVCNLPSPGKLKTCPTSLAGGSWCSGGAVLLADLPATCLPGRGCPGGS